MSRKLLIVGFGSVVQRDGRLYTQAQMKDYFAGLAKRFDQVVAFMPCLAKDVNYGTELSVGNLTTHTFQSDWRGITKTYQQVLAEAKDSHVLFFVPACSRWFPIFPAVRRRSVRLGIYLADNPQNFAGSLAKSWMPGVDQIYTWSYRYLLKQADIVIARGKALVDFTKDYNTHVEETIPMTSFSQQLDSIPQQKDGVTQILFIGRVSYKKGIQVLIDACRQLKQQHANFRFMVRIAGDGQDVPSLKEYAREQSVDDCVQFLGWIDGATAKERLIREADIHVLPSIFTEGVPRSIDEAIYYGVPTIASDVGGISVEYTKGEVMVVPPKDIQALADSIYQLANDRTLRDLLTEQMKPRQNWLSSDITAADQHAELLLKD